MSFNSTFPPKQQSVLLRQNLDHLSKRYAAEVD